MNQPSTDPATVELLLAYQAALARGVFTIQQCRDCGKHVFYPRAVCPHCGATELKWVEPTGKGVVHSAAPQGSHDQKQTEYSVAMIELEEGPRLLGRVMDVKPDKLTVGLPVSAHIGLVDDRLEVVFYNKEQGSKEW